jgi:hypothetical protein
LDGVRIGIGQGRRRWVLETRTGIVPGARGPRNSE